MSCRQSIIERPRAWGMGHDRREKRICVPAQFLLYRLSAKTLSQLTFSHRPLHKLCPPRPAPPRPTFTTETSCRPFQSAPKSREGATARARARARATATARARLNTPCHAPNTAAPIGYEYEHAWAPAWAQRRAVASRATCLTTAEQFLENVARKHEEIYAVQMIVINNIRIISSKRFIKDLQGGMRLRMINK